MDWKLIKRIAIVSSTCYFTLSKGSTITDEDPELDNEVCELLYGVPCAQAGIDTEDYNTYGVGTIDEYDLWAGDTNADSDIGFLTESDEDVDYAPMRRVAGYKAEDEDFDYIDEELAAIFGVPVQAVKAAESAGSSNDDGEHTVDLSNVQLPGATKAPETVTSRMIVNKPAVDFWGEPLFPQKSTSKPVVQTTQQTTTTVKTTLASTTKQPIVVTTPEPEKFVVPVKRARCNNLKDDLQCEALKPYCNLETSKDESVTAWMRVNCRDLCDTCNQFLFGVWSEWSECTGGKCTGSNTEAQGQASRQRICYDNEGDRSNECLGDDIQYRKCGVECQVQKNPEPKPQTNTPTNQKSEIPVPCLDNLPETNCIRLLQNNQCRNPAIAFKCQKTCMACTKSGITDKTIIRAPDADRCFDKDDRCDSYETSKCSGFLKVWMKEN